MSVALCSLGRSLASGPRTVRVDLHGDPLLRSFGNFADQRDVPQVVDQIRQDNHVEVFVGVEFVRVRKMEIEGRVALFRSSNHLGRQVDSNAVGRLQAGKQIALSTPDLEHALAGRNCECEQFVQAVEVGP